MRVLHRWHRDVTPFHPSVRTALDEVHAGNRRHAHQVVYRVDLGRFHQAVNHESMLARIDIPKTLMMTLEVQTVWRNDSEEPLQWREAYARRAHACEAGAFAALHVVFKLRWRAVAFRSNGCAKADTVCRQSQDRRIAFTRGRLREGVWHCHRARSTGHYAASGDERPSQKRAAIITLRMHRLRRQKKFGGFLQTSPTMIRFRHETPDVSVQGVGAIKRAACFLVLVIDFAPSASRDSKFTQAVRQMSVSVVSVTA